MAFDVLVRDTLDTLNDAEPRAVLHSTLQAFVRLDGFLLIVVGDPADAHEGGAPHVAATMAAGSLVTRINGLSVCRQNDAATCGHLARSSGGAIGGSD